MNVNRKGEIPKAFTSKYERFIIYLPKFFAPQNTRKQNLSKILGSAARKSGNLEYREHGFAVTRDAKGKVDETIEACKFADDSAAIHIDGESFREESYTKPMVTFSVRQSVRSQTPVRLKGTWYQSRIIPRKRMSYGSLCIFLYKRNFSAHPSNFHDPLFHVPEFPLSFQTGFFLLLRRLYCYRANGSKCMQLVDECRFCNGALPFSFGVEISGIDECNCPTVDAFKMFDNIDIEKIICAIFFSLLNTQRFCQFKKFAAETYALILPPLPIIILKYSVSIQALYTVYV